ncbi:MAG: tetratricopeptide repeat protein [Ignavibacteriaceae bacterium]|nr:tetratricopeptide repeat protein [Ignavibacteriaceae bacterium]
MNKIKIPLLAAAFAALFSLSGCTVWYDFTTYFNLYYNVSLDFEQAEAQIIEQRKDLFSLTEPALPGNSNQLMNKVIEKCSKLLQFNSESSFVDDALMMLGKSFFYQKNYLKSLRKFQEIIATQKESGLILEARLWEAKSEIALRNYSTGVPMLEEVIQEAYAAKEEDLMIEGYVSLIRYYLQEEDDQRAIRFLLELVGRSDNSQVNSLAMYKVGELYLKNNDPRLAGDAFERVLTYTSDYETEFNALVKRSRVKRELGETQQALSDFRSLRSEAKYSDKYDVIDLEIGISLNAAGRPDAALEHFYFIDTSYASSVNAAGIKYEIASLYEEVYKNYDSASVYYQKGLTVPSTADYLEKLRFKAQLFTKYTSLTTLLNGYKRDLTYTLDPAKYSADSAAIADTQQVLQSETARVQQEEEKQPAGRNRERDFEEEEEEITKKEEPVPAAAPGKSSALQKPTLTADSLSSMIIKASLDLGNLFFTEFEINDSAFYHYNYITENFKSGYALEPKVLFALGSFYLSEDDTARADSLFNYIYDNFKTDRIVNAAADKIGKPTIDFDFDPAKQLFIEAEKKMLSGDVTNSYNDFYNIFINHPSSPFASKSLYTCGFLLENDLRLGDSAVSVYDTLVKYYPSSQYASAVTPKVSFYRSEKLRIEANRKDSLMRIEMEKTRKAKEDSLKNAQPQQIIEEQKPGEEKPEGEDNPEGEEKKAEEPGRYSLVIRKLQIDNYNSFYIVIDHRYRLVSGIA